MADHTKTQATLEVLVSTCNEGLLHVFELLGPPHPRVRYLIVHQRFGGSSDPAWEGAAMALARRRDVRLIASETRGLSANRNECLRRAEGDVLLLADDDVRHLEGAFDRILLAFEEEPRDDVVTFQAVDAAGALRKNYGERRREHGPFSILSVSSVEIALRRSSIERAGLSFDERFGLGTSLPASEEAVFLSDARRAGLSIVYRPQPIVEHPDASTGGSWRDPRLPASKGALFRRLFGLAGYPLFLAFALRMWPRYRAECSFVRFLGSGTRAFCALAPAPETRRQREAGPVSTSCDASKGRGPAP